MDQQRRVEWHSEGRELLIKVFLGQVLVFEHRFAPRLTMPRIPCQSLAAPHWCCTGNQLAFLRPFLAIDPIPFDQIETGER